MVRPGRLELPTPAMSRRYSNQLSYGRVFQNVVRLSGLEPPTPAMSRRYSNQLSYGRTVLESGVNSSEFIFIAQALQRIFLYIQVCLAI